MRQITEHIVTIDDITVAYLRENPVGFDDGLLPPSFVRAIEVTGDGPDEVLFNDGRLLVERRAGKVSVTGVGTIASPFIYAPTDDTVA